jgi:hypothetical protein
MKIKEFKKQLKSKTSTKNMQIKQFDFEILLN